MSRPLPLRTSRTLMVLRAAIAAIAAAVVTFTQARTGEFSLIAFQSFVIATVVLLIAEQILRRGDVARLLLAATYALGAVLAVALPGGVDERFHLALLIWAASAGIVELAGGLVARRAGSVDARDRITVGALTCVLAIASLLVSPGYALDYFIAEANSWFTLTGTIIGVGLFGGWAAVIAVYLGIGAFSPAPRTPVATKEPA